MFNLFFSCYHFELVPLPNGGGESDTSARTSISHVWRVRLVRSSARRPARRDATFMRRPWRWIPNSLHITHRVAHHTTTSSTSTSTTAKPTGTTAAFRRCPHGWHFSADHRTHARTRRQPQRTCACVCVCQRCQRACRSQHRTDRGQSHARPARLSDAFDTYFKNVLNAY